MASFWRKSIAVLQIVGGVAGVIVVTLEVAGKPIPPSGLIRASALATLFVFAAFAGVMLWRDTRLGRVASVIAQCAQLPKFFGGDIAFLVSYGLDFSILALKLPDRTVLLFDIRLIGYYQLVNGPARPTGFGISLTSCMCLAMLLWNRKREISVELPEEARAANAVAAFQQSSEAIRDAKQGTMSHSSEHPAWVPSRGLIMMSVAAVLVLSACLGSCILFRFVPH